MKSIALRGFVVSKEHKRVQNKEKSTDIPKRCSCIFQKTIGRFRKGKESSFFFIEDSSLGQGDLP